MQTNPQIHAELNKILRHELTIINQYFLHARLLRNWGYDSFGHRIYKQSIVAMKNADKLIERIFFLEGLPNLQDLGKLYIGEDVEEVLQCDIRAGKEEHQAQVAAIAFFEREEDYVSRDLLESFIDDLEEYIDWLETQQELITQIGLKNYLQQAVDLDD